MRKLFLDDIRPCPRGWDCVRSYQAFVDYIEKNGLPRVISFDHDLGMETVIHTPYGSYEEKTGYDCAVYLEERGLIPGIVAVHSMNPVGAQNIMRIFMGKTQVLRSTDVHSLAQIIDRLTDQSTMV